MMKRNQALQSGRTKTTTLSPNTLLITRPIVAVRRLLECVSSDTLMPASVTKIFNSTVERGFLVMVFK
jgi:hypothetical protein